MTKAHELFRDTLVSKLGALFDDAIEVLERLDVSEQTRKDYKYRIRLFTDFATERQAGRDTFLEFKRYLGKRDDLSVATKNKYLATARIFLKEIHRQGYLPTDITLNVRSFGQSLRHKREGVSHREIERLVDRVKSLPNDTKNTRLKALFCLLVLQGLRQVEVSRLDVKDLDLPARKAYVLGKGRDDKEAIHLLPETMKALKLYMRVNRVASGALFKSLGNRKSPRVSTATIRRELKSLFASEDIDKTVHGLRHYYVTKLLERLDVRDVRKFSRHRSLEVVIVYDDEIEMGHRAEEVAQCFKELKVA